MRFNPPTKVPVAAQITHRSKEKRPKDAPCEVQFIYQDPAQPPTTTSIDDSSQLALPDEGDYGASSDPIYSVSPDPSKPPDLERHARKCCICSHPDRDAIEDEFIRWDCPRRIAKDYQIADRASFYRHAHATGLYARRRREFARVLENILECVEHSTLEETADVIIRASRVYARLDENGNWVEPRRTHVILTGPAPPQFAGNPVLADSFELQPRLEHQEISLTPAKRRDRTSKRKRDLIATADPARLVGPGRICGPKEYSSNRVKKTTPKSKAKKKPRPPRRLIATPPKLENGPTS
jgi:hypothetical protein